jgi:hypothetical protein
VSRAFPSLDVIPHSIYRPPYALGWLREEVVYERHPAVTPEFISQACCSGRVLVLREQPAQVVWLRPHDDDWAGLEAAARAGRVAL